MDSSFNDAMVLDMDSLPKFFVGDEDQKIASKIQGGCIILGVFLGFKSDYPSQPAKDFYLKHAKNSNLV